MELSVPLTTVGTVILTDIHGERVIVPPELETIVAVCLPGDNF